MYYHKAEECYIYDDEGKLVDRFNGSIYYTHHGSNKYSIHIDHRDGRVAIRTNDCTSELLHAHKQLALFFNLEI